MLVEYTLSINSLSRDLYTFGLVLVTSSSDFSRTFASSSQDLPLEYLVCDRFISQSQLSQSPKTSERLLADPPTAILQA